MPFIISRTNRSISREQEQQLKTRLGKAIELVPGKSEQYLMLCFEPNSRLWLRGDDSQPIAYIEAAIWGNEAHLGYDQFTAELADRFLYNLRYATIVDTRPTTKLEEILKVVRQTGIDEQRFLRHYQDSSAETALDGDQTRMHALGIHTLPAYLLTYEGKQMLIRHLIGYDTFCEAICQLTNGCIHPQPVEQSLQSVRQLTFGLLPSRLGRAHASMALLSLLRQLLEQHPLISPIELREALDFRTTDNVRPFIQPLIDSGEVSIRDVKRGWFIVRN